MKSINLLSLRRFDEVFTWDFDVRFFDAIDSDLLVLSNLVMDCFCGFRFRLPLIE